MLHLNIGPSALGLGLLVPMTRAAGFDVCVIGRPGDRGPKTYGITGLGSGDQLWFITVDWFEGPHVLADLPVDLVGRLASDEPLLITASLRDAIAERHGFVAEVLDGRPSGAETIVLACENSPHTDYGNVLRACERGGALMLRTVVNRMCLELERDSERRRNVSVHRFAEWLVERPPGGIRCEILNALSGVEGFEVVDDIIARLDRKLWLVNGAHQALALMGRLANSDHRLEDAEDLSRALAQPTSSGELEEDDLRLSTHNPLIMATLGHLQAAMIEALRICHPHLQESFAYSQRHVTAYSEHRDSVARVLGAFRRRDLVPFLDALNERIGAPARICFENNRSVAAFKHIIYVLLELLASIDAFEDNADIRRHGLETNNDALAVVRFQALIDPWMDEMHKRTAYFAQLLADQRAAFED
jgi:hypothetical protein